MPTLQGKAVFLMPIRQADVPNQCSSSNKAVHKSFMVLLHLHCPSGAPLRFAVCHTTCSSYGIRHGSFCVLHATSFISSFFPLHYTTFVAWPFATHYPEHKPKAQVMHIPFRKPDATILTGFHSATLRPTFISVAFSPPAANNFARLAYHRLRCGASLTQTLAHALPDHKSLEVHVMFRPFTVCPSLFSVALLSTPAGGARSRLRSALTSTQNLTLRKASLRRLWRLATLPTLQPLLLPGAATLLFAAGAFTFFDLQLIIFNFAFLKYYESSERNRDKRNWNL